MPRMPSRYAGYLRQGWIKSGAMGLQISTYLPRWEAEASIGEMDDFQFLGVPSDAMERQCTIVGRRNGGCHGRLEDIPVREDWWRVLVRISIRGQSITKQSGDGCQSRRSGKFQFIGAERFWV